MGRFAEPSYRHAHILFTVFQAIKLGLFIPRNIRLQFEQWVAVTGIKVVVRPPFTDSKIRRRTVLYDYPPLPGEVYESPYIVCDEAHDFYIVGEDESVAFVQLITNGKRQ